MKRTALLLFSGACLLQTASAQTSTSSNEGRPMPAKVVRENGKVLIQSVPGWSMGEKESSPNAAQEAAMLAVGETIDYRYLVGVSGLAFRMQISAKGFCPSSPHPNCGYACAERAEAALPWRQAGYACKPEDTVRVKEARRAVVASIDRGVPVSYGSEENGLIIGYQKGGDEWICQHPLRDGGRVPFVETAWPWGLSVFTGKRAEPADGQKLAAEAIKQAVEMAKTPERNGYILGLKAWETYLARLRGLDGADEKTRGESLLGNSWLYECIVSYRGCAAWYLRAVAPGFPEKAREHMHNAADLYEKMSKETLTGKACVIDIAPLPWTLKEGQQWTSEMRKEQIRRLEAAFELEKGAVKELEAAVKAL